jgi:hypothetical protein
MYYTGKKAVSRNAGKSCFIKPQGRARPKPEYAKHLPHLPHGALERVHRAGGDLCGAGEDRDTCMLKQLRRAVEMKGVGREDRGVPAVCTHNSGGEMRILFGVVGLRFQNQCALRQTKLGESPARNGGFGRRVRDYAATANHVRRKTPPEEGCCVLRAPLQRRAELTAGVDHRAKQHDHICGLRTVDGAELVDQQE